MSNDSVSFDLILGSDFLRSNNLKLVIDYNEKLAEERLKLFSEVASVECAENSFESFDTIINNIVTDFDKETEAKLISIISEVENSNLQLIKDDFAIKIKLKNDSTFAYATRRFSFYEKMR